MQKKRKAVKRSKKIPRLSHVKSSLVYVAPHKHTGHRLTHKHTSHGALLIFLIVAGIILFFSLASLQASGITRSGNVTLTAIVPSTPPTTGAVIKTPSKQSSLKNSLTEVTGTCPSGTIAAVYNNGQFSGSSNCTTDNTFSSVIQLNLGTNTLQAQNYDALNQAGPVTEQVTIAYEPVVNATPTSLPPAVINKSDDITIDTSITTVPAPQPTVAPCYNEPAETVIDTNILGASMSCFTQNVFVGEKLELPISLWGGLGPYILSIDWGDSDSAEEFHLATSGRHVLAHTYSIPKPRKLSLHVADASGQTYQMESVVQINSGGGTAGYATDGTNPVQAILKTISSSWIEASVPIYWAAVALFLGFWVGDLFQRFTNVKKPSRRRA